MRPVFLIGMMASGKTTLGAAAASATGLAFVDLDAEIERRTGATVAEVFAAGGEAAFAAAERAALGGVCGMHDVIVACGGGTPCRGDNMDVMLGAGTVVWLEASAERTVRRILEAPAGQRPLVADCHGDAGAVAARIAALGTRRLPHYSRAHFTFDSSYLDTAGEIAASVEKFRELMAQMDK